jgi:hypothetical protein
MVRMTGWPKLNQQSCIHDYTLFLIFLNISWYDK